MMREKKKIIMLMKKIKLSFHPLRPILPKNTALSTIFYRIFVKMKSHLTTIYTWLTSLFTRPIILPSFFTKNSESVRVRLVRGIRRMLFTYVQRTLQKLDPTPNLRALTEAEEIIYLGKIRRLLGFMLFLAGKIFWLSWKETKRDLLYVLTLGRYGRDDSIDELPKVVPEVKSTNETPDAIPLPSFLVEKPVVPLRIRIKNKIVSTIYTFLDGCLMIFFLPIFFPALWKNFTFKLDYWAYTISSYGPDHLNALVIIALHWWSYIPSNFNWYQRTISFWKGFTFVIIGMATFVRSSLLFRLEDLRLPSFIELGYPISWAKPCYSTKSCRCSN